MRNSLLVVVTLALACTPVSASVEPVAAESPPADASAKASAETAASDADCELFVDVTSEPEGAGAMLLVSISNPSATSVSLQLQSTCPGGPTRFSGLPDGYDYYQTCNMGACAGPEPVIDVMIAAGGTAEVDAVMINPGGATCQSELAPERYEISATLEAVGGRPKLCPGRPAILDLRN